MEEQVIKTIGLAFNTDFSTFSIDDCVPDNIEGWDSLGFLSLVTLLEEEFDISFDFEEIANMAVGGDDLLKIIKLKLDHNNDQ